MRLERPGVPPSPDGEMVFNQPISQARAMDVDSLVIKLLSRRTEQASALVSEFTFNHLRTVE